MPIQLKNSKPQIWLAPMEGVVDPIVRDLWTKLGGIDVCVTEFIRVTDRLHPDSVFLKDCPELKTNCQTLAGTPVLVQLLGGQPGPMAANAERAANLGAPGIDLNFGCPAKTVNRHDGGASLLKNPSRVFDVTSAVRNAVPEEKTVSAKVRLGFSDKNLHLEIAKAAEEAGASWLTVHARTRDEGYRPPAHWEYIAWMREHVSIPVIANGEIWTMEDYIRCRDVSGCEHVMIGRGLMSRPDLALQIKTGRELSWSERTELLLKFTEMSAAYRGEKYGVSRLKQMLKSVARNEPLAAQMFEDLKRFEVLGPMTERLAAGSNSKPAASVPN